MSMIMLKDLQYGDVVYYILKGEYDPRRAIFSFEDKESIFVNMTLDDTDVTEIAFDRIDQLISKEDYEEMMQPPKLYKNGDSFVGPNGMTFRIMAIFNNKYLIRIKTKDGLRKWSYTTEYRITTVATKISSEVA